MTTGMLLNQLHSRNVRLSVDNGRLRVNAPKGELAPDDVQVIRQHKPDLIRLLSSDRHQSQDDDWEIGDSVLLASPASVCDD